MTEHIENIRNAIANDSEMIDWLRSRFSPNASHIHGLLDFFENDLHINTENDDIIRYLERINEEVQWKDIDILEELQEVFEIDQYVYPWMKYEFRNISYISILGINNVVHLLGNGDKKRLMEYIKDDDDTEANGILRTIYKTYKELYMKGHQPNPTRNEDYA